MWKVRFLSILEARDKNGKSRNRESAVYGNLDKVKGVDYNALELSGAYLSGDVADSGPLDLPCANVNKYCWHQHMADPVTLDLPHQRSIFAPILTGA